VPPVLLGGRRPRDGTTTFFTAAQNVCFWPKADILIAGECPLSGVKRTSKFESVTSAFDPKRTF
jgi:hypothetical protein